MTRKYEYFSNKDIIKQYVNTGISIPEHQFNKLTSGLKKSYLRSRLILLLNLLDTEEYFNYEEYEFNAFDKEQKEILLRKWYYEDLI